MESKRKGRPVSKIELNLNQISESVRKVLEACENETAREKVLILCRKIISQLVRTSPNITQTNEVKYVDRGSQTSFVNDADSILIDIAEADLPQEELDHLFSNIFENLENKVLSLLVQIRLLEHENLSLLLVAIVEDFANILIKNLQLSGNEVFRKIELLSMDEQIKLYTTMGQAFNNHLWKESVSEKCTGLSIPDLINVNKVEKFAKADKRIQAFFAAMTQNQKWKAGKQKDVELANLWDAALKGRNSKYVSIAGLKEHLVCYISSSKSKFVSDILCHSGGKGNRHLIEQVLDNSEIACKFENPHKISLFVSFDNIQQLFKSYRLSEQEQNKVYAVIVTSILAILPDGLIVSDIQYRANNSLSSWFHDFGYDKEKGFFYNKLDNEVLKDMTQIDHEDMEFVEKYWLQDVETELTFVSKETREKYDFIDITLRENEQKRIRTCADGHINRDIRANRKKCTICGKYLLEEDAVESGDEMETENVTSQENHSQNLSSDEQRALYYMHVENVSPNHAPIEKSMGAIEVNPNNIPRIKKVLDDIKQKTDMDKHFCVQLTVENENIVKTNIENEERRSWILLSCDGLPMKSLIQIIENSFQCITCGENLEHVSEIGEHARSSEHTQFFQKYGCFVPNVGQFHYQQVMNRSYTKLLWEVDFKELCQSIKLNTPKAMFMIEKGTDFRKHMDFIMSTRKAKIRELVTPFVKYAKTEKIAITTQNFQRWIKENVKSKTYLSVLNIERIFGTCVLLFRSSYRANNLRVLTAAKNIFSSLFHINNNSMYLILDMWSQYFSKKMEKSRPELQNYLETRLFCNSSGKPFRAEPYDEKHEEYNRKGMRFQNNKTEKEFANSFTIVNTYVEMRETVLNDLGLDTKSDQSYRSQNFEPNIHDMRLMMRARKYLSEPTENDNLVSLSGEELDENILNIFDISRKVRQDNILKVMNRSDFFGSYTSNKIDFFDKGNLEIESLKNND